MKKKQYLIWAIGLFLTFIIFTTLVALVDVKAIGPQGSSVGFSSLNGWFFSMVGEHEKLYKMTDWKWYLCFTIIGIYGLTGLIQWINRKNMFKVDGNILALGCFYLVVLGSYFLFENIFVNYSPSLMIDGELRSSYPSTTVLMTSTVLISCIDQTNKYIKNKFFKGFFTGFCGSLAFGFFLGRTICGVHWITDIIGALLLSGGCLFLYYWMRDTFIELQNKKFAQ